MLIKHFIKPTYNNWDLDIKFHQDNWTVYLVGFVYSHQYEVINRRIAREGITNHQDISSTINSFPTIKPTVSLNYQILQNEYDLSKEQAINIVEIAKSKQNRSPPQPLSLLTMLTPDTVNASLIETELRGGAVQMGGFYGESVNTENAILEIALGLANEGLDKVEQVGDMLEYIQEHIIISTQCSEEERELIILYHLLIWKTAGANHWTHTRHCGEAKVTPYLPELLEATSMEMSANTCINGEFISPEVSHLKEDTARLIDDPENWAEISFLEFLNATKPKETNPVFSSQQTVQITAENDKTVKFRPAEDRHFLSGESIFIKEGNENDQYVWTDGDLRKLYERRPAIMENMLFGQFVTEYIFLYRSREGYDAVYEKINQETNLGPPSTSIVIGSPGSFAPQSMLLQNIESGVMKRRTQGKSSVPLFLNTGRLGRYGNKMMFTPWRRFDEDLSGHQIEQETVEQKEVRLSLFPMSVFLQEEYQDYI